MSLAIVIPTKNEAERLQKLFPEIHKVIPEAKVVIVNTPIPDDTTKQIVESFGARYIENPNGFGRCLSMGIYQCQKYDYVITMDADHDPVSARLMYTALSNMPNTYDLAIGIEQGSRIQRKVVNVMLRFMLGISQKNPTCGLRCYRGSTILSIIPQVPDEWFFIQIQLLYNVLKVSKIKDKHKGIVEVPFPPAHHTGVTENTKFYKIWFKSLLKLWWSEIF